MADKSLRAISTTVADMSTDWAMIEALMGGTTAMRAAGKAYLPQFPQEDDEVYKQRLATAVLHPVFKRTVLVNAARPFSKAINIGEKTPAKVREWTADIDLQGTTLPAFCVQVMGACLSIGLHGVLVDCQKATEVKTQAEEKAAGIRPYCVHYKAGTILGWKTQQGNTGLQLSQLRLLECVEVNNGDYGTKIVEQVRVLTPGAWATYRQDPKNTEIWQEFESGTNSISFIPFVFFYGERKGFGIGHPPLRDLAFQNVEHWQSASDQQSILHVARVPILFLRMMGDEPIKIGAGSAIASSNEKGDAKYVEHTGAAIEAGKESLIDLQDRMRSAGAELISLLPSYTTATQVSSDTEATKSLLQQIVEVFEESIKLCLDYMAEWVKETGTAEVDIYKDYGVTADGDTSTLGTANTNGVISKQTHFEELQRRDVLDPERTWEDEQARLAADTEQATKDETAKAVALAAVTPQKQQAA